MLSEREKALLRDYQITDLKPGEPQPKMTWRDKLRFHRYLRALAKATPFREVSGSKSSGDSGA